MKCRVCGYELADGRTYCPMCGTKVSVETRKDTASAEMAWNTKDFPKPKKMEDIEMNWGNMDSFMKRDASEGYVTVEKTPSFEPKLNWNNQLKNPADFEIPSFMNQPRSPYQPAPTPSYQHPAQNIYAQPSQPVYPQPETPAYRPAPAYQPSYGDPYGSWNIPSERPQAPQPQLVPQPQPQAAPQPHSKYWYEQNFTASGTMKTGPAVPLPQDVIRSTVPDATIQYVHVDRPRQINYENNFPDYTSIPSQEQKRPEEFNTFITKNEEFQKLLDQEYERINSMRGEDYDGIPSEKTTDTFVPESSIKAQDVSEFERSLFGEPQPAYPDSRSKEEPKLFEEAFHEENTTGLDLDELIADPLDPRFDIDTVEMTIRELKDQEQQDEKKLSERREKLAKMEAARDAYFKFLDETPEDEKPKRFGKKKAETEDATKINLDGEEKESEAEPKTKEEIKEELSEPMNPALVNLYDGGNEEEEERSKHGFLKFIGVIIIIAAVLELAILALKQFMPDAPITAMAAEYEAIVFEAVKGAVEKAWAWIQDMIQQLSQKMAAK